MPELLQQELLDVEVAFRGFGFQAEGLTPAAGIALERPPLPHIS
ncbi:hypothetical protein [Streptomyces sp. NPDC012508]